jgi:hypothetical protein
MKRIVVLTEAELKKIISLVVEQINLDDYEEEDLLEAFLIVFRQWINEKLGDDVKKYPLSYLLKKYMKQFEIEMDVETSYNYDTGYNRFALLMVAKKLINKGKYSLPSLNTQEKFTDKYKKILPYVIQLLELPDFVNIEFDEKEPNRVMVKFNVDFLKMIVSDRQRHISPNNILHKLKQYLEKFAAVEFGNPNYGQIDMNANDLNYVGVDEWVKTVLNKKIKKEIKELPSAKNKIHSIKFIVGKGVADIKIVFKETVYLYRAKKQIREDIEEYLKNLGYNTEVLKVDF